MTETAAGAAPAPVVAPEAADVEPPVASDEIVVLDYGGQYSQLIARRVPVLGICYGMQLLARELGGRVEAAEIGEFGRSQLTIRDPGRLLAGLPTEQTCWMSHRDTVVAPPPGFAPLAASSQSPVASLESVERGIYGIQFHPEVVHTPYGRH